MKLYQANNGGTFYGTQAEVKKAEGSAWVEVDVPTDKPSLIAYLNANYAHADVDWEKIDPDRIIKDINEDIAPERAVSYTDRTVQIDEVFGNLPIEHQLTLTTLALENARTEIGKLKGGTEVRRSWAVAETSVEDDDDALFG